MTQIVTLEQSLVTLGIALPQLPMRSGNHVSAEQAGDVAYLAGAISTGPSGAGCTAEDGYAAARVCALIQLAVLKRERGSLDRAAEILTVKGCVNAAPGFADSPAVINGASDPLAEVFGEALRHVRSRRRQRIATECTG